MTILTTTRLRLVPFELSHLDGLHEMNADAASAAVMKRLGMDDLGIDTWYGHSLRTYRTTAEQWDSRKG
jgi:hypothetical protein